MKKLLLLVLLVLILLMVATVALYQWLGWSGLLVMVAVIVLLGWFVKLMARHFFQKLFMMPFKAKGAVLKDAQTRIHSITPAPTPPQNEDDDDEFERPDDITDEEWMEMQSEWEEDRRATRDRRYYYVDVTITPAEPTGQGFTLWEPTEMVLVKPDANAGVLEAEEAEVGNIEDLKIWNEGEWHDDEEGKYSGPQRLQLHVGIDPNTTQARFSYYFEVFGDIDFSSASLENPMLPEFPRSA